MLALRTESLERPLGIAQRLSRHRLDRPKSTRMAH